MHFLLNFVYQPAIEAIHMKRFSGILILLLLLACSKNTERRNPYLQEIGFRIEINLNLPLYSPLNIPGNSIYLNNTNAGIRGVFVTNTGFDLIALEASCPNHIPNNCSTMEAVGQTAQCACEGYEYSLFTGQQLNTPNDGERYFDMLIYNTARSGSTVVISN